MQEEMRRPERPKNDRPYQGPVIQAVITQAIFYVAAPTCTSDMGASQWGTIIAAIPFWGIVAFLIFRNPVPSRLTLAVVRWGLIPILLVGVPLLRPIVSPLHTNWYFPR
jgi:hypothetical protein